MAAQWPERRGVGRRAGGLGGGVSAQGSGSETRGNTSKAGASLSGLGLEAEGGRGLFFVFERHELKGRLIGS